VSDALIPILKTKIDDIQVDILYACIPTDFAGRTAASVIASLDELTVLKMDEQSLQSINGYRDSQTLLSVVPNLYNFRTLLRVVKLWAGRT